MKIKKLTIAAMLTAISIIIPMICPKIVLPPFTATLFAHVPIMIAICISLDVALFVTIGNSIGFFFAFASVPFGYLRSFSHIFFVIVACLLLNRKINVFLIVLISGIIHAVSETIIMITLFFQDCQEFKYPFIALFLLTLAHHIVDSIFTASIVGPLKKMKFIKRDFNIILLKR